VVLVGGVVDDEFDDDGNSQSVVTPRSCR
jgi:hypothetical protein